MFRVVKITQRKVAGRFVNKKLSRGWNEGAWYNRGLLWESQKGTSDKMSSAAEP
jgi:hypothetical protein